MLYADTGVTHRPIAVPRVRSIDWGPTLTVVAAVAYAAVLLVAYYQGDRASAPLRFLAEYVQYLPLALAAGIMMLRAQVRRDADPGTRRAVAWLGIGLLGMSVGMVLYITAHQLWGQPPGIPLMGDAVYVVSYVAVLAGLLCIPRRTPRGYEGWKPILDAAVLLLGIGLLGWYFIARPTAITATGPLDLAIRLAYPILDVAFLFALNRVAVAGGPAECRRGFRWLSAAVIAYVIAESLYQVLYYGTSTPHPTVERLSESSFALSYLLFLVAAVRYAREPAGHDPSLAAPSRISPYSLIVSAAVPIALLFVAIDTWTMPLSPLIIGIVGLTMLLLVRQWLTIAQNTQLLRQQAQRESDARVAALVRHSSDVIIVANPDGTVRYASPSSDRVLGIPSPQLAGRHFAAMVHEDDHDASASLLARTGGGTATATLRLMAAGSEWRDCEVVSTDLTDEPAIQGIVLVARDLTDRNAMEMQLRQAQKMEAVGRLAGGVAHDFNNLLTTILASTELVLEGDLEPPVRTDLLSIRQAAELAAGLTGQLLAFSRQDVPERRSVDLRVMVDDTVKLLRRILGEDIVVRVDAPAAAYHVRGDANQLVQVVINLALNARDAMPDGGTLTIALDQSPPARTTHGEHGVVTLTIRDSGAGMDEATQARMFEPFFTTKAAGQGTGLGLAMTSRIIEQHGGTIAVESTPGGGTTLIITLPGVSSSRGTEPHAAGTGIGSCGTEVIVLAEDEGPVREIAERILTRLGYTVRSAVGGEAALALLDECSPPATLLLTDVMMPGMTGPELAAIATARDPNLKVLYISGYPGDALSPLGIGGDGVQWLQKPFTPRELAGAVRAALDDAVLVGPPA